MHWLQSQQEREQAAQEHENILDAAQFVICTKKYMFAECLIAI